MPKSKQKTPTRNKTAARKGAAHTTASKEIKKSGKITPKARKAMTAEQKISDNKAKQFKRKKAKGRKPPGNKFGEM